MLYQPCIVCAYKTWGMKVGTVTGKELECSLVLEILGETQGYMHRLAAHELPPGGPTMQSILVD